MEADLQGYWFVCIWECWLTQLHCFAGAGAFVAAILLNFIRAYLVKPWMRKYIPIPMCLGIPAYLVTAFLPA